MKVNSPVPLSSKSRKESKGLRSSLSAPSVASKPLNSKSRAPRRQGSDGLNTLSAHDHLTDISTRDSKLSSSQLASTPVPEEFYNSEQSSQMDIFEDALENHRINSNNSDNQTAMMNRDQGSRIEAADDSVRSMGTTSFLAVAKELRLQKKERSARRLHDSGRSQSSRNPIQKILSPSKAPNEQDPLVPRETFIDEPPQEQPTVSLVEALSEMVFGKFVSIFLIFMPFAWMAHEYNWGSQWVFWLNFFVMIPLAAILGDFTEEVAAHTNQVIGGLINATFGNAVEVVVAIQALMADEIRVVQASMIGSIFSNLLLVLGCCFFFGGLKYKEQSFNSTAATANMSLLALSSIALVLPTPFAEYYDIQDENVLHVSRVAAIFLIFMYAQLLIFQLKTHAYLFEDDDDEEAEISLSVALIGLSITTLLITFFSDMLVDSIDGFCADSGVSRTFVGLIIIPIVGNAVEHVTAVTVAMKNKMDLAMGIAVGSCTQISLFVVPLTVLIGWGIDKNMTLNFPHFEIGLYILSVFTVSVCVSNPKGNWLEGSLLITTYFMLALGFWYENVEEDF